MFQLLFLFLARNRKDAIFIAFSCSTATSALDSPLVKLQALPPSSLITELLWNRKLFISNRLPKVPA